MDNSVSDKLLEELQAGNSEAFDFLYRSSRVRLYVLSLSIVKESEAANDLVQDFFIDFWEKKTYLQIQSSLIQYMMRSVKNRSYNFLDKRATNEKLQEDFNKTANDFFTMTDRLENENLKNKLETAVQNLPTVAGKVFTLHYIEKLTHSEIADKLNISKSTVSSHIDRALKQLRKELKES